MNATFLGFQESKKRFSSLPDQFFSELLPAIDNINELKITIYLLWLAYTHGDFGIPFVLKDFLLDQIFINGLQAGNQKPEEVIRKGLQQAVQRGTLIQVAKSENDQEHVFFINSPRGRQAAELLKQNQAAVRDLKTKAKLDTIQPNIFRLYEENIGPLTPIIADALRDAQGMFPLEWIEEAVQLAVKNNVRRWKYVETILTRWQEEGKDGADRRDTQEDHRRYIKGEYGEIGQH